MQILMFLVPGNIPGVIIVVGIIACFIGWLFSLIKWSKTLQNQYGNEIIALKEVSFLVNAIHQSTLKVYDVENHATLYYLVNQMNHMFGEFCLSKTVNGKPLDPNSPVAAHVRMLFQAGMLESKVDAPEVLKNTLDRLFHKNIVFRNVLATFIVAGLLGTLLGLAESLNNLPISLKVSENMNTASGLVQSNLVLKQAIDDLFIHLRSAFAPSIWGTGLTIVGIAAYMYCTQKYCQPVKHALVYYTNSTWVPYLVPTTSLRAIESSQLVELQMGRNIEAAKRVADFAENIEHGVAEFDNTLNKTNVTLKTLSEYGDQMHFVVTTFKNSIGHIGNYQQEIQALYSQFVSSADMHQQTLNESKGQINGLIECAKETFVQNGTQVGKMLEVLDRYEAYYMQEKQRTVDENKEMLAQMRRNLASLDERNKEIIETIGQPMVKNVAEGFNRLEDNFNLHLTAMVEKLSNIESPMADTVRLMSETLQAVEKNMDRTLQSIMREATKQNDMIANTMISIYQLSQNNNDLLVEIIEGSGTGQIKANVGQELVCSCRSENIQSCTVGLSGQQRSQTSRIGKTISRIAAVVVVTGLLGSFGYAQYKLIDLITESQRTNEKLIMEISKRQQSPIVTEPAGSLVVPANSSAERSQGQQPGSKSKKN